MTECHICKNKTTIDGKCERCGTTVDERTHFNKVANDLFLKAISFYQIRKYDMCLDYLNQAVSVYPFNLEICKSALFIYLDLGKFNESIEMLLILKYLEIPGTNNYYELIKQHVDLYNEIIDIINSNNSNIIIAFLKKIAKSDLSTYEKIILSLNPITSYVLSQDVEHKKSSKIKQNLIFATIFLVLCFTIITISNLPQKIIVKNNDNSKPFVVKDIANTNTMNELLLKINKNDYLIYPELKQLSENNQKLFNQIIELRNKAALIYYHEGLKHYKLKKNKIAKDYFEQSYFMANNQWFSEHCLYFLIRTEYNYEKIINEDNLFVFLKKYKESVYYDDLVLLMSTVMDRKSLSFFSEYLYHPKLKKSPYYQNIKKRVVNYGK